MSLIPEPWWPVALLAIVLTGDIAMSILPMKFIRDCLEGVNFPREWWWTLLVIKSLTVVGLVAGIWIPGIALAATIGVIVYFTCASYAHIHERFTGQEFWLNCLGMLALSIIVLGLSFIF